jgi:bifunctional non-homologous end joining protein LigD
MLATTTDRLPSGAQWAFEFKWDGVRALLDVQGGRVRITSRRGAAIETAYPELVAQAATLTDVLLDGEIVAFVDDRPSFGALQTRMHVRASDQARRLAALTPVTYVAFDLLRDYGVDLTGRPWAERRETLDRFAEQRPEWTVSPSFDDGPATEAAARAHGLEGVVAKRLDSRYHPGVRSTDWLKLRFARNGDFVVIGWEAAADQPRRLSSLVLGFHDEAGALRYAGKVGSGLSAATATRLRTMLHDCPDCPLDEVPAPSAGRRGYWCVPEVVVDVEFTDWTDDGRLRHPVFRGIRSDKTPDEARGDA